MKLILKFRLYSPGSDPPADTTPPRFAKDSGQATRRASETVGLNNPDEIGIKKKNAKILHVRRKTLFKPCSTAPAKAALRRCGRDRTRRLEASLGGKNFSLTQMAALVVVNLSRLKLPIAAIKKDDITKLTTVTIYKFLGRKTIAINLPQKRRKMYNKVKIKIMKKILITGSSGFLGSKLLTRMSTNYEVIGAYYRHGRPNLIPLDVTNENDVQKVFAAHRPDIVIHTVALSDPDYCEEHPDETERVNFGGTKNIVADCKEIGARLIHISTSGVFNGEHAPYREGDPVCPINKYGESKARAEEVVQTLDHFVILRFDFLYGYNGIDSSNGLISKLLSKRRIEANPIQKRKPLLVDDVATVIERIIETNGAGIYHLAGPDNITKYELCKRLEETLGITGDVYPVEATAQKAKRARDTSLLTERLAELGVSCTPIEPALEIIREQYVNSNKEGALKSVERL